MREPKTGTEISRVLAALRTNGDSSAAELRQMGVRNVYQNLNTLRRGGWATQVGMKTRPFGGHEKVIVWRAVQPWKPCP